MNSRFDEVLEALRTYSAQASVHNAQIPTGSHSSIVHDLIISQPSDPIFIPSSIVPKNANVHINSSEEKSSVVGFDDSLSALKAARKKK
jgi:hypothetical protein